MPVVCTIKVEEGYGAGEEFLLPDAGEFFIGRHSKCFIRIKDPDISRYQAKFTTKYGKWAVEPVSEKTQTYYEGSAIEGPQILSDTDKIVVGTTVLVVEIDSA